MPADRQSDLVAIALFAPVVVASRLQMLALQGLKPTVAGRREAVEMLTEKPLALMLGGFALQAELLRQSAGFWAAALRPGLVPLPAWAPALLAAAATGPMRRKVRANARRLTRR